MKRVAPLIAAIAILIAAVGYSYTHVAALNNSASIYKSKSQALKDCSAKIPDSSTSQGESYATVNSYIPSSSRNTTNYTKYPAFDRCMATKGY